MILSLLSLAFGSLLLLVVPFVFLGFYIIACVLLRQRISNLLMMSTAAIAVLVVVVQFSIAYLLPIVGPAALLYLGGMALVLMGALIEWPIQRIKDDTERILHWIQATVRDVLEVPEQNVSSGMPTTRGQG